jgi:aldehyde dehydrogenase (NAD+)
MREYLKFFIDGKWVDPITPKTKDVVNPATESVAGHISLGSAADVDVAVKAARKAFESWSQTTREERVAVLERIVAEYGKRSGDIAAAITEEMGAPGWLAVNAQAPSGGGHFAIAMQTLKNFSFEEDRGGTMIVKEPIGVAGFITPWNWPIHQLAAKVAPALAAGCTIVLKPSELAPFSAYIVAEVLEAAGVPAGVFNLVNGEGPVVGAALAAHPDVDLISITGSTRAGIEVARTAAPTVKRVLQELGGKSANIVLEDADLPKAIGSSVFSVMMNSGQSCVAPTRLLVPKSKLKEILALAKEAAEGWTVGDPKGDSRMGPVANENQWNKIQAMIKTGIAEGATVVTGGLGKPEGLTDGFYIKPTIFADVKNSMTIAQEEIFGPVLVVISYDDESEAIKIANDSQYGLGGYVQSADLERARKVASKLRAGYININNADMDLTAPFGGYKRSGNGREFGEHAFDEFLELKSILGYRPKAGAAAH